MQPKPKVTLLLNMIAPSRIALLEGLAANFDLTILHGGMEKNRNWQEQDIRRATVKRIWGWQLRMPRRVDGQIRDYHNIHINPGLFWDLFRLKPDVLLSNEMGLRSVCALLYGTVFSKPVWVWWGGTLHTERSIGPIRRGLRWLMTRWASNWLSYGRTSTEYLERLGVPASRIVEIQNSVDERHFASELEDHAKFEPEVRPALLCAGQLIARKGIDLLLRAAARVQAGGDKFSLLFVGNGPDENLLRQMARDLGLAHVAFLGSRSPQQMRSMYRTADALIFPTREDVWGLVANEAILSGLPVLCSVYAGCANELFTPDSIFDPEDSDEFAEKLRAAVHGKLPAPCRSRLVSTEVNVQRMTAALASSIENVPRTP